MEKQHPQKVEPKDYIFGTRPVIEAVKSGREIEKILIQKGLQNESVKELFGLIRSSNIPVSRVPLVKLDRVTKKNHQGVICFLSAITYHSIDHIISESFSKGKVPLVVLLDRITDVRNFGALARTAEVAGVDALVIPSRGSAQIGQDAMKASAGALNFIPICRSDNLKETITFLRQSGLQVVASSEKGESTIYSVDLTGPTALLLGSEEDGISPAYLKLTDQLVTIPQTGKIASLNVSVAGAVVIFETIRQRMVSSI
ncbi:MAG: 23S rRNA (guanosine(2251)-2'-O)-methyltransferase RlmB [Cyclobacteriaceae bacterium]